LSRSDGGVLTHDPREDETPGVTIGRKMVGPVKAGMCWKWAPA